MAKKSKDPFYTREKEKYEQPIPSREWILQVMEDFGKPITAPQLFKQLAVEEPDQAALGYRLKAMLRDGQIMQDRRKRYCLLGRITLFKGKIHAHTDGSGFFIPEDKGEEMVLSAKEMRTVMHGDTILAYPRGFDRRGRPEGVIHEILEHAHVTVVGRFFLDHGLGFIVPNNKRLTHDILIPVSLANEAQHGQVVLVELITYPSTRSQAIGKIIHILGDHMAPGMEIQVAIHAHNIPATFPEDVLEEVAAIPQEVLPQEISARRDLRALPFVTIDGEDAKDFDDAVYCYAKPKGGFQLYVAIADVSHYVKPDSALDKEAILRGNSVYFPGKVVPMLPEALSNGICSLNPKVDRLCLVAEMAISAQGKITRSHFYRAVFQSQARLTYTEVATWLTQGHTEEAQKDIWPTLCSLQHLYHLLLESRKHRGAIEFDTTETQIEFDEQRKIQRILPVVRNDAHRIIEECMLAANMATAQFLKKADIPALYRVHMPPEEAKIVELRKFLGEFGLQLGGGKNPKPKDFQETLQKIAARPEKHLIETVMLRSLKQAQYVEKNQGHFGLAYTSYTHFTSPIRRYPDLLIHRALAHLIDNQAIDTFLYSSQEMSKLGKHCSSTERRADDATREAIAWLKCEYMQDKIGQSFTGTISGVTSFGLFVELDDIYVEGLVHITSLKNDYYLFHPLRHRLVGERSNYTYHLGDKMKIMVAKVDVDERKIDFEPLSND